MNETLGWIRRLPIWVGKHACWPPKLSSDSNKTEKGRTKH